MVTATEQCPSAAGTLGTTGVTVRNSKNDAVATLEDLAGRDFATVDEVAQILRADPRTIRRRIVDGSIPATRAGDWRIPVSWLREQARVSS